MSAPRRPLTYIQHLMLEAIGRLTDRYGYPPTVRELAAELEYESPSTAHDVLRRLRRDGYVTWVETHPRTITLIDREAS